MTINGHWFEPSGKLVGLVHQGLTAVPSADADSDMLEGDWIDSLLGKPTELTHFVRDAIEGLVSSMASTARVQSLSLYVIGWKGELSHDFREHVPEVLPLRPEDADAWQPVLATDLDSSLRNSGSVVVGDGEAQVREVEIQIKVYPREDVAERLRSPRDRRSPRAPSP
jgi:hypothetical protein